MKIDSGRLDRLLTLYEAKQVKDAGGQVIRMWAPVASFYAQRLELRTVDTARAGQRDTYAMGRFLIRYRKGLTTSNRLLIDGVTFDILAVDEPDRRATMVLTVEQSTLDPIVVTP